MFHQEQFILFLDLKMLECPLEANSVVFDTVSWSALHPEMLWRSSRRSSLFFQTITKTRTVFLFCSSNRLTCRKHNFNWLLQRSVYGYNWTSRTCSWTLRNLILRVFIFQIFIRCCGYGITPLNKAKMTGASLGFGETLLNASYIFFLMSVSTPMFNPRAPTLAAVEEKRRSLRNEEGTR